MKFKVGDIVKAVTSVGSMDGTGAVGVVRKIKGRQHGVQFFGDKVKGHTLDDLLLEDKGWWCEECDLELIPDGELNGFKVGDIVKARAENGCAGKGEIGVVIKVNNEDVSVWWEEAAKRGGGHDLCGEVRCGGWYVGTENLTMILRQAGNNPSSSTPTAREPVMTYTPPVQLKKGYVWIARDKDGKLFAYKEKPVRDVGGIQWYGKEYHVVKETERVHIEWEDAPLEIKGE